MQNSALPLYKDAHGAIMSTKGDSTHDSIHFRATARIPMPPQTSARATLILQASSQTVVVDVVNCGLGGLCVQGEHASFPQNHDVVILLQASWLWEPLRLQGTIVWSRGNAYPARAGIAFKHDSPAHLKALVDFLGRAAEPTHARP
jgi:hypothetical protein